VAVRGTGFIRGAPKRKGERKKKMLWKKVEELTNHI